MVAVISSPPRPSEAGRAEPAAVELSGVSKSFGPVRAVRGLDLQIRTGEIVAVLGPNGAGKSTTNEMILGLIRPDAGRARVFGLEPRAAVVAGHLGAMLQGGPLLSDATVKELLRLMHGLHRHPLPIGEVIERADLGEFLTTKTDKLSGGQAQRLRYGLAILPDPELLILDEPTVAMDVEIRRRFWQSMREVAGSGTTVLFATHYLEEADEVADRIVVMAQGRIVADGTGAEIKSRVAGRTISAAADGLDRDVVARLPGVAGCERTGARLVVHTTDSDATLRALLHHQPQVRDLEIIPAKLEDAFLALTGTATGTSTGHGHEHEETAR